MVTVDDWPPMKPKIEQTVGPCSCVACQLRRADPYLDAMGSNSVWREFFAAALNPAVRPWLRWNRSVDAPKAELKSCVIDAADIADAALAEAVKRGRL